MGRCLCRNGADPTLTPGKDIAGSSLPEDSCFFQWDGSAVEVRYESRRLGIEIVEPNLNFEFVLLAGSSAHLVKLLRVFVFVRTGAVSGCMHDAYAQQIEFRASVHGAFDELQSMDVPFHRAVAPGLLQCSQHRSLVAAKILRKGCQ